MMSLFLNELQRNLKEQWQFRFNLVFANISLVIMFFGLSEFIYTDNKDIQFFTFFCWYLCSNGIAYCTYVLEGEVLDRTLISLLQSKQSVQKVLLYRCINKLVIDLLKGLIVFGCFYIIGRYHFSLLAVGYLLLAIVLVSIAVYCLGLGISSFIFFTNRLVDFVGLFSYGFLFFTSITLAAPLLPVEKYLLPFYPLRQLITEVLAGRYVLLSLGRIVLQCILLSIVSLALFQWNEHQAKKRGDLFDL